ncbi:hypothetical protein KUF71_003386 [Frankliniella fusca]|uniref:C2H2-type domain-containing protein n=1 Tax=Frankliniella fusca TaxID=407009 RepID=A0AAE1GT10_9NEOP|nr:hypothetical protein KUF71_003386 [Frankliniella fusca]
MSPCGHCGKAFRVKTSLIRHITTVHINLFTSDDNGSDRVSNEKQIEPNFGENQPIPEAGPIPEAQSSSEFQDPLEEQLTPEVDDFMFVPGCDHEEETDSEVLTPQGELNKASIKLLVDLRCTASLTGKAIEGFEAGALTMMKQFSGSVRASLTSKLTEKGFSATEIQDCGLVKPQHKYLDSRIDQRLNPSTSSYVQTQVTESFQSISVQATLKSLLSNKKVRNRVFKDRVSKDGVLRSFVDGSKFKDHSFLTKHENVLHILLFYYELEIANSLGSKTIIHKLGVFLFQILNLPPEFSSALSSIHLLALAHADDLKKPGAFKKVLTPFIHDMKKLSSDYGLPFNEEDFLLRAVLAAFTADTAAAHDLLGFLGPSAKHFCRKCMVTRAQIRADANATGAPRTKQMHEEHVAEVLQNPKASSSSGVKRDSPLDSVPFFSSVEHSVFDAFHDISEGCAPLVLKLVLRKYIVEQKLLTVTDLNQRIASFSYGLPDAKNKPSANFLREMFTSLKKKLKQTGSQMWCLMRRKTPTWNWLQDIMQIVFSFEITQEDLVRLQILIFQHNKKFQELFVESREGNYEAETEENVDDPDNEMYVTAMEQEESEDQAANPKPFKVHVINKLHHLTHYPEMIKEFGPLVRTWCAKFEGRMKIFRQHAAICCNFKNPPKTMAEMFQLSNMNSFFNCGQERDIEFQKGCQLLVSESHYFDELVEVNLAPNQVIISTNYAVLNGEEYRPGLFVSIDKQKFALIDEVFVANKEVFLDIKPWTTIHRSPKYNTFQVSGAAIELVCPIKSILVSTEHSYQSGLLDLDPN